MSNSDYKTIIYNTQPDIRRVWKFVKSNSSGKNTETVIFLKRFDLYNVLIALNTLMKLRTISYSCEFDQFKIEYNNCVKNLQKKSIGVLGSIVGDRINRKHDMLEYVEREAYEWGVDPDEESTIDNICQN